MRRYYISWYQYDQVVKGIVNQISKTYSKIFTFPMGGYIPAVHLAKLLGISEITVNPLDIDPYTLIVDDISDSGDTLNKVYRTELDIACICYKEGTKIKPTFICLMFEDYVWVVFPWESENSEEKRGRD